MKKKEEKIQMLTCDCLVFTNRDVGETCRPQFQKLCVAHWHYVHLRDLNFLNIFLVDCRFVNRIQMNVILGVGNMIFEVRQHPQETAQGLR
jgi:hypothetical protein